MLNIKLALCATLASVAVVTSSSSSSSVLSSFSTSSFSAGLSTISTTESPSSYDYSEVLKAPKDEADVYLHIEAPKIDLLDDDDSDLIPKVYRTATRDAREGIQLSFSSSFSTSSASLESSSDFGTSSIASRTSINSDKDNDYNYNAEPAEKRSDSPCDFAKYECGACYDCAKHYDPERCFCIQGNEDEFIGDFEDDQNVCIVVAEGARLFADIETEGGDDCMIVAGRYFGQWEANDGENTFIGMETGYSLFSEIDLGDDKDTVILKKGHAGGEINLRSGNGDFIYVEDGASALGIYSDIDPEEVKKRDSHVFTHTYVIGGVVQEIDLEANENSKPIFNTFVLSTGFVGYYDDAEQAETGQETLFVAATGSRFYEVYTEGQNAEIYFGGAASVLSLVGANGQDDFGTVEIFSGADIEEIFFAVTGVNALVHSNVFIGDLVLIGEELVDDDLTDRFLHVQVHNNVSILDVFTLNVGLTFSTGDNFTADELDIEDALGPVAISLPTANARYARFEVESAVGGVYIETGENLTVFNREVELIQLVENDPEDISPNTVRFGPGFSAEGVAVAGFDVYFGNESKVGAIESLVMEDVQGSVNIGDDSVIGVVGFNPPEVVKKKRGEEFDAEAYAYIGDDAEVLAVVKRDQEQKKRLPFTYNLSVSGGSGIYGFCNADEGCPLVLQSDVLFGGEFFDDIADFFDIDEDLEDILYESS